MSDSQQTNDIASDESVPSGAAEEQKADTTPPTQSGSGTFNWARVITTALVLFLIGSAAGGSIWYVMNLKPTLHPVTGIAYLDDEPLTEGALVTYHEAGEMGAISVIDEDGRFELQTNGEEGAYAGKHKVTLVLTNGGFPPISLVPEKYTKKDQTPFEILVDARTQEREIKLELYGRIDAPTPPAEGMTRPGIPTSSESEMEDTNTLPERGEREEKDDESEDAGKQGESESESKDSLESENP